MAKCKNCANKEIRATRHIGDGPPIVSDCESLESQIDFVEPGHGTLSPVIETEGSDTLDHPQPK
jgi:hypothetical protein